MGHISVETSDLPGQLSVEFNTCRSSMRIYKASPASTSSCPPQSPLTPSMLPNLSRTTTELGGTDRV